MIQPARYQRGDRVRHVTRPEWGLGTVESAEPAMHEDKPAQRLAIHFSQRGRVTVNSAVAPLVLQDKDAQDTMTTTQSSSSSLTQRRDTDTSGGWLASIAKQATANGSHELWALPRDLSDPFNPLHVRLRATLDTFRFSTEPRALIDWAIMQTGLADPLTKYTRHELEQGFARFARDRDLHLLTTVREMKRRSEQPLLQQAMQTTKYAAAKQALQRAIRA
jgi:hypothetical protein